MLFEPYVSFHIFISGNCVATYWEIAAHSAYWNFSLIAPFPEHCLLLLFIYARAVRNQNFIMTWFTNLRNRKKMLFFFVFFVFFFFVFFFFFVLFFFFFFFFVLFCLFRKIMIRYKCIGYKKHL